MKSIHAVTTLSLCLFVAVAGADEIRVHAPGATKPPAVKELEKKLAPVKPLKSKLGYWVFPCVIHKKIRIDDPSNPNPFSKVEFLVTAYGSKGTPRTPKPVLLRTGFMVSFLNQLDSSYDIDFFLSNRHTLLGLEPVSDAHFAMLRRVLDPGGAFGLSDGESAPRIEGRLVEGVLPIEVRLGALSEQERIALPMKSPYDPRKHLAYKMGRWLLSGIGRAEAYPAAVEKGFRKKAIRMCGFACSLAHVDPELIEDGDIARAKRIAVIGISISRDLISDLGGTPQSALDWGGNPALPITPHHLARAALDVVIETPAFERFLPALGRTRGSGEWSAPYDPHRTVGGELVKAVLTAATGEGHLWEETGTDPLTRAKAKTALVKLAGPRAGAKKRWGKDSTAYVKAIAGATPAESQAANDFLLEVLAETGWGPPRLAIPTADRLFDMAWSAIRSHREAVLSGEGKEYNRVRRVIACLASISRGPDKRSKAHVRNKVDEIVTQLSTMDPKSRKQSGQLAFMNIWNTLQE
ncbi:MAG: hypothetical protein QNJ98_20170 [Planctomycetota bacterium]|nr:hypothetical protein [Planctomycetota bacterium]